MKKKKLITVVLWLVCAFAFILGFTIKNGSTKANAQAMVASAEIATNANVANHGKAFDVDYDVSLRIVDADGEQPGYEAIVRLDGKTLQVLEGRTEYRPDEMEKFGNVIQTDVNFDGQPDLLICLGGMNVTDQTFIYYDAWLSRKVSGNHTFSLYKDFRDITNAEVDATKKRILSHYMARDGSFTYSAQQWVNGKLELDGKSWNVKKKLVIR